jgi:hypothetical protein
MDWPLYVLLGVLAALAATGPALAQYLQEARLGRAGLDHAVTDEDMLQHMARLFWALGYRVYRAGERHPEFDLILVDGLRQQSGVVTRHWRRPVAEADVAAVAGAAAELEMAAVTIVSVKGAMAAARQRAEQVGVALWSLPQLIETLDRVRESAVAYPEPPAVSPLDGHEEALLLAARERRQAEARTAAEVAAANAPARGPVGGPRHRPVRLKKGEAWDPDAIPKCPRCGRKMVVRNGARGNYWGCPAYPRCLGTRER